MKKRPSQYESDEPGVAALDDEPLDRPGALTDAALAERCLAGEVAAWEQLYAQCHEPLCVSIRILLGRQNCQPDMIDEIAARVWYSLIANDGELLSRYDAKRGARLATFMRMLAKSEIVRHYRQELRRRNRELEALRAQSRPSEKTLTQQMNSLAEFLCTLTPQEKIFCNDYLLAEPAAAEGPYSSTGIWQMSHRIYRKLLRFLNVGS